MTWRTVGRALRKPDLPRPDEPAEHRTWWAPEVVALGGRLYLYYSTGIEDRGHQIRVAVGDSPEGPFEDVGVELAPHERFAIDPHPFVDDDGSIYLFYARDLLDGDRVGTSIAADRLVSPIELAGSPVPALPPSADWQLYQRGRRMYGSVYDWHTLEGPFVRRRLGRYWLLYSGRRVDRRRATRCRGPSRIGRSARGSHAGAAVPALLRTVPGLVGPGHCSVVEGPDGDDWLAYHAWDPALTARRMCLDRIEWTPDGPRTPGPTTAPQPVARAA